jgi:hypothetical protein
MRIAVLQNRNEGAVVGEQLLECQITLATKAAHLDEVLHVEQREPAPMLHFERFRHA